MMLNAKLRERRKSLGMSMKEVANIVGVAEATISRWETGDISNMKRDKIALYAKALNLSPVEIMGLDEPDSSSADKYSSYGVMPIKKQKIRLLGEIACGEPIFCDEDRESYVEVGTDIRADFCLRAKGDSMINARIMDGDIVFIREQSMVDDGEIAAVVIEDEATLKRVYYYREENKLVLQAENPKYRPLVYSGAELDTIRILGKAVAFQSDL